jgi:hypothetical protein
MIAADPTVAFDSFLSSGFATMDAGNGFGAPLFLGSSQDLGNAIGHATTAMFSNNAYDVSYGAPLGQPNAGISDYLAARLTLSDDAVGTLSFKVDFGNSAVGYAGSAGFYPPGAALSVLPIVSGVIAPSVGMFNPAPEPIPPPVQPVTPAPPVPPPSLPTLPPGKGPPGSPPETAPGLGSDPVGLPTTDFPFIFVPEPAVSDEISEIYRFAENPIRTGVVVPALEVIEGLQPIDAGNFIYVTGAIDEVRTNGFELYVKNYDGNLIEPAIGRPTQTLSEFAQHWLAKWRAPNAEVFDNAGIAVALNAAIDTDRNAAPEPSCLALLAVAVTSIAVCARGRGTRLR